MYLVRWLAIKTLRIATLFALVTLLVIGSKIALLNYETHTRVKAGGPEFIKKYQYYNKMFKRIAREHGADILNESLLVFEQEVVERTEENMDEEILITIGQTMCIGKQVIYVQIGDIHMMYSQEAEVGDTIRHEIAHALDCNTRGKSDHGPEWQKWANKLGAIPSRVYRGQKRK